MITKFKIFENYDRNIVITHIIKEGKYRALNVLKNDLPDFLDEHFTSLPVKNVKETMEMYNIKNDKITKVYKFLDDLFSRFESKQYIKNKDIIIYFIGDQVYANHNTKTKDFFYNYDKIHSVLVSEFGLNYQKVKELIRGMVDEHLKLGVVTPRTLSENILRWMNT